MSNKNYLIYIVYDSGAFGDGEEGFPDEVTLFRTKESAKHYKKGFYYENKIDLDYCYKIITTPTRLETMINDLQINDDDSQSTDSSSGSEGVDMNDDIPLKGLWVVGLYEADDEKDHKIDYENEFEVFLEKADAERYVQKRKETLTKKLKSVSIMCEFVEIFSNEFAETYYSKCKAEHEAEKANKKSSKSGSHSTSSSSTAPSKSSSSSKSEGEKKHHHHHSGKK